MSLYSIGTRSRPGSNYSKVSNARRQIMSAKGPRPENKETAILTIEELQRIKEQCHPTGLNH